VYWLYLALAFVAGLVSPMQSGMNSKLQDSLGWLETAFVNFVVGVVPLVAYAAVRGVTWPSAETTGEVPWWAWLAGALGTYFVVATFVTAERLGAAVLVTVLVAGQAVSGLVLDHYGLLGFEQQPVTWTRLAGVGLVLGGVLLLQRS
jgi:transporter family-2 protein